MKAVLATLKICTESPSSGMRQRGLITDTANSPVCIQAVVTRNMLFKRTAQSISSIIHRDAGSQFSHDFIK
jgi:hypothetical protein